jgi:hypothetical protein
MTYLPVPDLFLVGSTSVYDEPGVVVGGNGSPFVEVTSPPFRPLGSYLLVLAGFRSYLPRLETTLLRHRVFLLNANGPWLSSRF